MTTKTSTGLRNYMLATGSARDALQNGKINYYSGDPPASADDAATGVLLCSIDKDGYGNGFTLDNVAVGAVIAKAAGDLLRGTGLANGRAGYFRHVGANDTGTASTTEPRIQGSIAKSGSEGNVSNPDIVQGAVTDIDEYAFALPTF